MYTLKVLLILLTLLALNKLALNKLALNKMKCVSHQVAGFTLVEIMISLSVGIFLCTGILSVFTMMRGVSSDTLIMGQLQHNARLALTILRQDLQLVSFWGAYQSQLSAEILAIPPPPVNDCHGGNNYPNSGSFPVQNDWPFSSLWAGTVDNAMMLNCLNDANLNTDILQVKRVIGSPILFSEFRRNRFYLIAATNAAAIVSGADNVNQYPVINHSQNWMYQHRVYYIADQQLQQQKIPTLMRRRLVVNAQQVASMTTETVVDGIEYIRIMFGVDVDLDGRVDNYVGADQMLAEHWQQNSLGNNYVRTARLYVMARSITGDLGYQNDGQYQLGDRLVLGNGDHYRRLLLTTTVILFSGLNGEWHG